MAARCKQCDSALTRCSGCDGSGKGAIFRECSYCDGTGQVCKVHGDKWR